MLNVKFKMVRVNGLRNGEIEDSSGCYSATIPSIPSTFLYTSITDSLDGIIIW